MRTSVLSMRLINRLDAVAVIEASLTAVMELDDTNSPSLDPFALRTRATSQATQSCL
ncbi:hypothetical protein EMIT0P265_350002 [Pseudomonas zeae]